jgi:sulfate adenylyltransferase subunit 1 (EFTu-like GTPase family)
VHFTFIGIFIKAYYGRTMLRTVEKTKNRSAADHKIVRMQRSSFCFSFFQGTVESGSAPWGDAFFSLERKQITYYLEN